MTEFFITFYIPGFTLSFIIFSFICILFAHNCDIKEFEFYMIVPIIVCLSIVLIFWPIVVPVLIMFALEHKLIELEWDNE